MARESQGTVRALTHKLKVKMLPDEREEPLLFTFGGGFAEYLRTCTGKTLISCLLSSEMEQEGMNLNIPTWH